MTINIAEYPNVKSRALKLGLSDPINIVFIPRGFLEAEDKSDLLNEASVSTLRTLFRQNNLDETRLDSTEDKIPYLHENSFDWIAPAIFFSASYLSENPEAISIACGIIASYVTDYFKGIKKQPVVKLEVVVETTKNKKTKKITYEGGLEGIKELAEAVKEAVSE